jgi:hypothetical protein
MDTVATKLKAIAAELREHPERWTQGEWARNEKGDVPGMFGSEDPAVCWCAFGFLSRENMSSGRAMDFLSDVVGESVPIWNDRVGRTALEVADAFDRAAELASQTAGAAS